ncbi:MAG: helix-turn-helix domain-containing protein [Lachnospiraceae bacterium]|nr:helix-turn-helix domain-containing protein [Lachnospiraceae bacterium]
MTDEEMIRELKPSDLSPPYNKYADLIGIENFIKLSDVIGGNITYFPTPSSLLTSSKRKRIVQEYLEGARVSELSEKYHITDKTIYKYIQQYRKGII